MLSETYESDLDALAVLGRAEGGDGHLEGEVDVARQWWRLCSLPSWTAFRVRRRMMRQTDIHYRDSIEERDLMTL
jgi:hypothetical protein